MLKIALSLLFVPLFAFAKADVGQIDQSQDQIQLSHEQIKAMAALREQGIELNDEAVLQMAKAERAAIRSTQTASLTGGQYNPYVYLYCGGFKVDLVVPSSMLLLCYGNGDFVTIRIPGLGLSAGGALALSVIKFTLSEYNKSIDGEYRGFSVGGTFGVGYTYMSATRETDGATAEFHNGQLGGTIELIKKALKVHVKTGTLN